MAKKRVAARDRESDELPIVRSCATEQVHFRLLLEDSGYAVRRASIENQAWRASRLPALFARSGCTRIPVVVHVVHRIDAENISQEQIDSQITVLNQDFRRKNPNISTVPASFQPVIADARLEFELATIDPTGSPTNGVTRTRTNVNGFTWTDEAVKSAANGGADPWPADRYLNIWVCRLAGGLLGYAQFPGGPVATDGIVITHTAFGTVGTAAAPFDRGRTAVHEIGHWLNLIHIWGDDGTGCSGSDHVDDTPNQGGPNVGTPTFPTISCGNAPDGDMFMNYMDYVDDAAMVMFSAGQVVRMQAALDGPRASIGSAISCGPKPKFTDEPVSLKFRDDPIGTLKFRDDSVTLKFRDDIATRKFTDDATIKLVDDPIGTLKAADDPIGTFKAIDDPVTVKFLDDVKTPGLEKSPVGDIIEPPTGAGGGWGGPSQPAPFILATPHHSSAWQQYYPEAATYEHQLAEYEKVLRAYADAEAASPLGERERSAIHEIYAEYVRLAEEYQQLGGQQR